MPVLSAGNAYEVLDKEPDPFICKVALAERLIADIGFLIFLNEKNVGVPLTTTWRDRAIYLLHGTVCIYGHKLPDNLYLTDFNTRAREFNALTDEPIRPDGLLRSLLAIVK
jgi:hypothetical protein